MKLKYFKYNCLPLLFVFIFAACIDDDMVLMPPVSYGGIEFNPEVPEADREAQITYTATLSSVFDQFDGELYAHIGMIEGTEWSYVKTQWNENTEAIKMVKVGMNKWSFTIPQSIRGFLGVPADRPMQELAMVIRNADGSMQSKNIYIPVNDPTFQPAQSAMAARPAGTVEGINIIDPTSVTLVLYDKDTNDNHHDYAYVIGDFNDWKISNEYQMSRDEATGCWWITLTGLNPQTEYGFQYYIGTKGKGAKRLADAYAEKILDPTFDSLIPASTYPNMKAYPADKTVGIISTFQTQPETYTWRVNDFSIQDRNNLVIYELLIRDFTETSDLNGVMEKLDYLVDLGVNVIELMPVQEFDANNSWGYNPCFFFAMDKAYGTKTRYKEFIDACHERGIAVFLDVVYNHATGNNPFALLYWDRENNATAKNNPWFNVEAPHPFSVFHDFNHESPLVRNFVKRNLQFLINEYNIDGFRFDLTKGFTQNSSDDASASNYDASRIAILKDYNATIKATDPEVVVILEHFTEEREEAALAEDGMKLWRNINHAYGQTAMGYPENSGFTALTTDGTSMPFGSWVGYMESHDEERQAFRQNAFGVETEIKENLPNSMKQLGVNAALFFPVPGPKMIWQFGELGYDVSIDEGGRTSPKPVKWEYLDVPERKGLYDTYAHIIDLRHSYPQLFNQAAVMEWNVTTADWNNGRDITLTATDGTKLFVVGNFTAQEITRNVPAGTWYDYMNNGAAVSATTATVPAHSFIMYTSFQ